MTRPLPTVLVPGLLCSPRLYSEQLAALWRSGPVLIADHTRHDSMAGIARGVLATAPSRFALVGLSMGGYVAFEIMRQAAERVAKLALLDTSARADTPEQSERRRALIALASNGRFADVPDLLFPVLVHRTRQSDATLRQLVRLMADETGPAAFIRQETAIIHRPDARAELAAIGCPTLVLVGDGDELTPPDLAVEIAQGISGSRLVVVPDCGHLTTVEQPRQVTAALVEWVRA